MTDFDNATYYDACESEVVSHSHPHDAIDQYVEDGDWDDHPHPITVTAFMATVRDGDIRELARDVAESALEQLDNTLYDFDGTETEDRLSARGAAELQMAIEAATMRVLREHANLETLHKVGERTYSVDEVRAIVGKP